jgi:hypothetical protein
VYNSGKFGVNDVEAGRDKLTTTFAWFIKNAGLDPVQNEGFTEDSKIEDGWHYLLED